jgi:hypothetical protein
MRPRLLVIDLQAESGRSGNFISSVVGREQSATGENLKQAGAL